MSNTKRRAAVFIDGSNLYRRMKDAGLKKGSIDYGEFSRNLILDRIWIGTFFYVAPVRPQDEPQKARSQQRFFSSLHKTNGVHLKLGVLRPRQEECKLCQGITRFMVEKGVDVLLTVDMISKAIGDEYDDAYLVSADADFVPAVEFVRDKYNKKVFCVAPKGSNYGNLANACNNAIPITQEFINRCQAP